MSIGAHHDVKAQAPDLMSPPPFLWAGVPDVIDTEARQVGALPFFNEQIEAEECGDGFSVADQGGEKIQGEACGQLKERRVLPPTA